MTAFADWVEERPSRHVAILFLIVIVVTAIAQEYVF